MQRRAVRPLVGPDAVGRRRQRRRRSRRRARPRRPRSRPARNPRRTYEARRPGGPVGLSPMETGLAGKRVLVTGASGGIGSACARAFTAEGAEVVVHYNRAASERRPSAAPRLVQADLTREDEVDRLFAEAGPLDVCAAVAGVWPREDVPVWELPLERWEETLRANLTATFLTARGFLRGVSGVRPRQPRPRRLDRGPLRRGRPRRLRRRQVRDRRRPAAEPEERGRARRPSRARERCVPGLDRLADDARGARRPGARRPRHAHHAAAQGRPAGGRRGAGRGPRVRRALRATSPAR